MNKLLTIWEAMYHATGFTKLEIQEFGLARVSPDNPLFIVKQAMCVLLIRHSHLGQTEIGTEINASDSWVMKQLHIAEFSEAGQVVKAATRKYNQLIVQGVSYGK